MIVNRWLPFDNATNVVSFNVYRSIIGFTGVLGEDVQGRTLQLKVNNDTIQTVTFGVDPILDFNTQIEGGKAYLNFDQDGFLFRSDIREAPGFVEIVGGDALALLQIGIPRLIEEKSEDKLIANVPVDGRPADEFYEYRDNDGSLLDFYALSSVDNNDDESQKTAYMQPVASTKPLCVIEGTLCNIEGARLADQEVLYKIADYACAVDERNSISTDELCALTSHNGRFSFAVIQGVDIQLEIPAIGFSSVVCVPEENFVFLNDLIQTEQTKFKSLIIK